MDLNWSIFVFKEIKLAKDQQEDQVEKKAYDEISRIVDDSVKVPKEKALIMIDLIKELKDLRQKNRELYDRNTELVAEKNSLMAKIYKYEDELSTIKKRKRNGKILNYTLTFYGIILKKVKDQKTLKEVKEMKLDLLSQSRLTIEECLEEAEHMGWPHRRINEKAEKY